LGLNPGGAGVTVPLAIVPFILQKKKDTTAISRQAKNLYYLCHTALSSNNLVKKTNMTTIARKKGLTP
jgi:hypothetical protein